VLPAIGGTLTGKLHASLEAEPKGSAKDLLYDQRLKGLKGNAAKLKNEIAAIKARKGIE